MRFPFTLCENGLKLYVRLTPKAKKTALNGVMIDEDDQPVLKASVTTVPEKGKANAALIKLLCKEWKLAKSDIEIIAGQLNRHKTLLLKAEPQALQQRLTEWMKQNDV
ncbi:DUF167 family protein [Terasakiella sp. A23]|uniref:DUF167 domain-containing protein n=1 Tax=Terasakiella sp. FCG-A23 TaxID=3080561 RepID=UPI002952F061|nr:DUF167 family protein [Terasakiella sp. A23]MDV7341660.1 DUF167 family protein [Terasakiella sp. A23]